MSARLRAYWFNFKWDVWILFHPLRARRLKKNIDAEVQYFRDEIEKVTAVDYRRHQAAREGE